MKKITLLFAVAIISLSLNAQNLIQNAGFENDPTTFTVLENTANVLMRIAGHYDASTQVTQPTLTSAVSVADGLWLKKAPNSGYVKGIVITTDLHEGTSCLQLQNRNGNAATGMTNWYQCVAQQRINGGLDNTKKYIAKFYAKVDATAGNVCDKVVAFVTDNTAKVVLSKTVSLTGGTAWTEYTVNFDLPAHITANPTANFAIAYFGIGNPTTYDTSVTPNKTNYSGVLLDNISLTEDSSVGIDKTTFNYKCYPQDHQIHIEGLNGGEKVYLFNTLGAKVAEKIADNSRLTFDVGKGIYLVRVSNQATKIIVK